MKIQDEIQAGRLGLVWSYILEAENEANPFEERKKAIEGWKNNAIYKRGLLMLIDIEIKLQYEKKQTAIASSYSRL